MCFSYVKCEHEEKAERRQCGSAWYYPRNLLSIQNCLRANEKLKSVADKALSTAPGPSKFLKNMSCYHPHDDSLIYSSRQPCEAGTTIISPRCGLGNPERRDPYPRSHSQEVAEPKCKRSHSVALPSMLLPSLPPVPPGYHHCSKQ